MNSDFKKVEYILNSLENRGKQLGRSLDEIGSAHEGMKEEITAILDAMGDLRILTEESMDQAQDVWNALLKIADRLFAMDEYSQQVGDLFILAFKCMKYEVYGYPGTIIEDFGTVELIDKKDESTITAGTVLRTLQIGLRREDGSIERYPKVIVAS